MAPKNSRTSRPAARSNRAPQSARAVRTAKAAQSGRIASRDQASSFYQGDGARGSRSSYSGYRSAYTPGSQGSAANGAYSRQSAASQYSRANASYSASRKSGRGKKIVLGVVIALLVVAIGGGSAFAAWMDGVNKQLTQGTKTQDELTAISDALTPKTDPTFTEPFYMMLIGSDRLDDNPDAGGRSDTNIVVRIDPAKNQATMVSIPRDTKIEIDGYGTNKFNAAYNYDGAAGAIREAKELLGVDISHYAEVNFEALKELVDAVGGIDVEVTERVDDPDADGTSAHPEWDRVIIEEGEQHLTGNQALVFARSRAYADGDFTRTANQRKVIMAIVNKVLAMNVTEMPGVVQSAASCVTTDLSVNDILGLAQQFRDDGDLTIYSAMVPSYTAYIGDVSYVINDAAKTKEMMALVEQGGDPSGITSTGAPAGTSSSGGSSSSAGTGAATSSGYVDNSSYYGTGTGTGAGGGTGYSDSSTYYGGNSGYTDTSGTTGTGGGGGTGYVDPNASGTGGTTGTGTGADAAGYAA